MYPQSCMQCSFQGLLMRLLLIVILSVVLFVISSLHMPKQQLQHQSTVAPHAGTLTRLTNSSIQAHSNVQTTAPASEHSDVLSTATAVRLDAIPRTLCYKFCLLHGYHANCSFTGLLAEVTGLLYTAHRSAVKLPWGTCRTAKVTGIPSQYKKSHR